MTTPYLPPPAIPTVSLGGNVSIPQLGYGVFQVPPPETAQHVTTALKAGYRHIDTAALYGNEEGVGQAIAESGIPADELFITTKVWNTEQGYERTLRSARKSLTKLGLDRVDLLLIHWPTPERNLYVDSWRALLHAQEEGLARAVGVSNFEPEHLRRLIDETGVTPVINQVELHPYLNQAALRAAHAELGIVTEAWSPLGQGQGLLDDPTIGALAARVGRSPAQVVLRWHLQMGNVVIPKSVTPSRIAENLEVFDFELSAADVEVLNSLERDGRVGPHPNTFN